MVAGLGVVIQTCGSMLNNMIIVYWLSLGFALGLDILTKWLVTHHMELNQTIPVLGEILHLTYVRNTGVAFSLLAEWNVSWRPVLFIAVNSLAMVGITIFAYRERKFGWTLLLPLGLVSGGAGGNLLDRIFVGTVVDFIEFSYKSFHFPIFNAADSAITVGVACLMILSFFNQTPSAEKPQPSSLKQ